jgi:hypothetical protein
VGDCNYYLKARFARRKDAVVARSCLARLLAEGRRAYDYWQGSRAFRLQGDPPPPSPEVFWAHFRTHFPLTTSYLGERAGVADYRNGLSGLLGCLADPADPREAALGCYDEELELKLINIWHCSDLALLERYLRDECGAVAAGSVSEENFDLSGESAENWDDGWFFDAIEL